MTEINYIRCLTLQYLQEGIDDIPEELYERLNDHSVVINEGVRIILLSRHQTDDEIMESWLKLKELKSKDV